MNSMLSRFPHLSILLVPLSLFLILATVYVLAQQRSDDSLSNNEVIELRSTILSMARAGLNKNPYVQRFGPIPDEVNMEITPFNTEYLGEWEGTAYNPVSGQTDDDPWITASGRRSVPGVSVAIDPEYWLDLLRKGAFLYIEGYGVVRVDDTGSKVKGRNRFDLMVSNRDIALELGRWTTRVWLITD